MSASGTAFPMAYDFGRFVVCEPMATEWTHHLISSASEICSLGHEFTAALRTCYPEYTYHYYLPPFFTIDVLKSPNSPSPPRAR